MNKAYKFRIYPNTEQIELLKKTFGCCRFIYNQMLSDKKAYYEINKENLRTTPAQYKSKYEWLKEVDSLALANVQLNLETAYRNFFRKSSVGFPQFKSKHKGHNSYTTNLVNGNIKLGKDGFLKLPKLGKVKIKKHRKIPENYQLKSVTISLTSSGKYFASILYECSVGTKKEKAKIENVIGLDFSMPELYIDSNGFSPEFPHPYYDAQKKLAKEQRKLSRRKKGGKNYKKQKAKVARLYEHITNQRKDFLHKLSRQIVKAYDVVCIEDLNMKGMSQALNFGKRVADNAWGIFVSMLSYKLQEEGKQLIKIDKWFPSSKQCSNCGKVKSNLALSERTYECECGFVSGRDINAAINIRNEGLRLIA